ncbi:hypothetical protein M2T35_27980, partial [Klebsiella pneumoniae]
NPAPPASHLPSPPVLPNPTQNYLKFFSFHSHLHPYHNPSLPKQIPSPIAKYLTNPTRHHSHIFQKVLFNAFLLFIHPAAKY